MIAGMKICEFIVTACIHSQTSLSIYNAIRLQKFYHLYVYSTEYYQDNLDVIIKRAAIQTFLQHSHILRAYEFFLYDQAKYFVIACQPYLQTLKKKLWNETKFAQKCRIMAELAEAVGQVHKYNFLHRQISLQSIFIDSRGRTKLAGFNLKDINQDTKSNFYNFQYAPQISTDLQSNKSDIWALGWVFLQILEGSENLTFEALNDPEFPYSRIKKIQNANLKKILLQMMQKRPEMRCDIARVKQCFQNMYNQTHLQIIAPSQNNAPIQNQKIKSVLKGIMSLNLQGRTLKNMRLSTYSQPWYYQFDQRSEQSESVRVQESSGADVAMLLQGQGVTRVWTMNEKSLSFLNRIDLTNLIDLNLSFFLTRPYQAQ